MLWKASTCPVPRLGQRVLTASAHIRARACPDTVQPKAGVIICLASAWKIRDFSQPESGQTRAKTILLSRSQLSVEKKI